MIRPLLPLFVLVLLAGCEVVTPTNPFDPETPPEEQAQGGLTGVIRLVDDADTATRQAQLEQIRVGLLDENGRRLTRDGAAIAVALSDVDAGDNSGAFTFDEIVPGTYTPF